VTPVARVVFALLVCATFGAFFVTQRLKRTPPAIQDLTANRFFSPNRDGRFDRARVTFRLKRGDDVTVTVVDRDENQIREFPRRYVPADTKVRYRWAGTEDDGSRVPDGRYRVRVGLRRQGRSILLPVTIRLDTTPPRPRVISIGPQRSTVPAPELLPRRGGGPIEAHFTLAGGRRPLAQVFRTEPFSAQPITELAVDEGGTSARWDGTVRGRRVRPGTYVVAISARDQAGNIGSSPPRLPPRAQRGAQLPGRGGVTVRYVAVQPPLAPVPAGALTGFGVDTRGERYRWTLRRPGERRPLRRGTKTKARLAVHAPRGRSGVYLLDVRTQRHHAVVPFPVQAREREHVLVVLPAMSWLGRDPLDDDGDGLADTLERGVAVRRARVFARTGLPDGFAEKVAPALIYLDRHRLRYDVTTDLALATGHGPQLKGHRGVLLAGDERWLAPNVGLSLRRFVSRGGRLVSLGTDSLRRQVRVTPRRLIEPTAPAPADLFGARLRAIVRRPVSLLVFPGDSIGLFQGGGGLLAGGSGLFTGYRSYEETDSIGPRAKLAAAAGERTGRPVIVGVRFGRGLVIRTGLPEFASRLSRDPESAGLMRRMWEILSRS
jgi:hypothetical protein